MKRAFPVLLLASLLLTSCGPSAAPVETAKVDPTTEGWYAETAARLSKMDGVAAQLVADGRTQEAAGIVTSAQSLQTRLLAAPRPTLEAMQAIADLDQVYGKMLIGNGYFGEARLLFQKNVTRWKTWKSPSPETERRLKEAQSGIAECDRHMGA